MGHRRENHEPHHHNNIKRDDRSDQTWSLYRGNLIWSCFMTALFIFGTQCFFWFLCFLMTSIMSAMASVTSWGCSSASSPPAPFTTVYACGDDAALQAALAASLLSSTQFERQQQQQQKEEEEEERGKEEASCRATRCAGGGDGCCTFRCLGRLFMIPIFMMSFCCPLCTFITVAFLFTSFRSGCGGCGCRRYPCSTWRGSPSGVGGSGSSSPRFRCCGTTGMATSAAAATTSETQQKQPDSENQSKVINANISASTAPKTTLQPLLQEVVAKDEPDEEDVALQHALAKSFLECKAVSSEPGPQPEPQPQHDLQPRPEQAKIAQLAQTVDHIGEEKGGDVATGFVEVMHDDDQWDE